jgi:hypothetical protein
MKSVREEVVARFFAAEEPRVRDWNFKLAVYLARRGLVAHLVGGSDECVKAIEVTEEDKRRFERFIPQEMILH